MRISVSASCDRGCVGDALPTNPVFRVDNEQAFFGGVMTSPRGKKGRNLIALGIS